MCKGLIACLTAVLSTGCSQLEGNADVGKNVPRDMDSTALIPRSVFFGNPDKTKPQLSWDGRKLSYLAAVDGVLNVWVGPIDDPGAAKPVTDDKKQGIQGYFWACDNRHILYSQDKGGDEGWHVYATDLESKETRDLTPIDGVQARVHRVSPQVPGEILIAINDREPQFHDIYRVNIATGNRTLIQQNDNGYASFMADEDFNIRVASKPTADGGKELFTPADDGKGWVSFMKIPGDDALTTAPLCFDKSGELLYMLDSMNRNTGAMVAYNLKTGERTLLASHPRVDADFGMVHPTERVIDAIAFTFMRREWKILDRSIERDFKYLMELSDGEMRVLDRAGDDRQWLVAYEMDDGPMRYYHFDRTTRKASFLFTNRRALESLPLTKIHPFVVKARDGLELVSYLSLPVWTDPDRNGRPDKPVPMVVMVHGGPWERDNWGYNPLHQWLTNRGYAVLSVNFRGSTGFGKRFINAANLEFGRKMQNDLVDAVNWAVKEQITEPGRVAIMGLSYGGYATLAGLTFSPDFFACGIDICGPSSLLSVVESFPPYLKALLDMIAARIGDPRTEEGRKLLTERSPLTHVDRISKPLLIGQGANDPRVKQAEADQIVKAMQEKGLPVVYVLFPDEGHGFVRPENQMAFYAVVEAFLAEHLAGRYEPVGEDFGGSSITIPVGADQVPGLPDDLTRSAQELGSEKVSG